MRHFAELYKYEVKKIMKRKLFFITLLICILFIILMVLTNLTGSYYVDGKMVDTHYHMFQVDREYGKALSGRKIDKELLMETMEGYGKIPPSKERYTLTEEYQTYARPYSAIFNLVWSFTDENPFLANWEPDEEAFYAARNNILEQDWRNLYLSDGEKEFWREKEAQLSVPFTYFYHEGYLVFAQIFQAVGLLMLLFTAVNLASVFPEEHARRTDQLMLSSAKGKEIAYFAKLSAGISAAAFSAIFMTAAAAGMTFFLYGAEGFGASLQISTMMCFYSYPMTFGELCLTAYGVLIITSIALSVFVMVLSEALHSNLPTLAIFAGMIILGMAVNIPKQYRAVSQLWSFLPTSFLSISNVFDVRPVTLFGHCFLSWQAVPVIYILCSILTAVAGKRIYQRYQVTGR